MESSRNRERQTERQREGQKYEGIRETGMGEQERGPGAMQMRALELRKCQSPLDPLLPQGPPLLQPPAPALGHGGITDFSPALGAGDTPP